MKKPLIFFIIFIICVASIHAQTPGESSALQRIDSLEKIIKEGDYVRIPNKDFEDIIDNKVNNASRQEVQNWVWVIVTFFGALMTLLTFWLNRKMKDEVSEKVELKSKNLDTSIDDIKKSINEMSNRISILDLKMANSMDMFWDEMAGLILDKTQNRENLNPDLEKKINHFLNYEHVTLSDNRQVQLIDALMLLYYYSKDRDRYKKMVELIRKYEDKFDLEPQTYANAAIAHSNIYELHGIESDRINCIDNCDKSIKRNKDYGIPYAVKLEVYMIDYVKAVDEKQKQEALENLQKTFRQIENNQSRFVPVDIIDRTNVDRNIGYLKPYYLKIDALFAREFNRIRERALDYLLANYSTLKSEQDKTSLNNIFQYGLDSNFVVIDGNWQCRRKSGLGDPNGGMPMENINIISNKYDSNFNIGNGLIFFHTATDPLAMNFYKTTETGFKMIPAIYQLENDILQICYDPNGQVRPVDFAPGLQPVFTLLEFERAVIPTVTQQPSLIQQIN